MIVKLSQLSQLRKSLHGKKIVFAGGTFDLFHSAHAKSFKNLKKFGNTVVISVSKDKRVKQKKGPDRPILLEKERLFLVDSIRYVDYCLLAPKPNKNKPVPTMRILAALKPDIFVTIDKKWLPFRKDVERLGVQLKIIPQISDYSTTTRIISRIIKRYCK